MEQIALLRQEETEAQIITQLVTELAAGMHLIIGHCSGGLQIMREIEVARDLYIPIWSQRERGEIIGYDVEPSTVPAFKTIFTGTPPQCLAYLEGTTDAAA